MPHLASKRSCSSFRRLFVAFVCREKCWKRRNTDFIFFQSRNIRFLTRQIYFANKSVRFKMLRAHTTRTGRLPLNGFALNKIDPALASFNRLWSRIPFIRNLMKNYSVFWIRSVTTAKNHATRRHFAVIRLAKQ